MEPTQVDILQAHISMLESKLQKATECIAWYADRAHWSIEWVEGSFGDYGTRAREAIKELADE